MSIIISGVGRIGKDAVVRNTGNGDAVTGFSLAMDNGWGDNKVTLWFDCSGWGKRYEGASPYLLKGAQVFVSGELGEREHNDKTYKTIRLSDLQLIGAKSGQSERPRQEPKPAQHADASYGNGPAPGFDDSEIPFAPIPRRQLW